MARNARLIEAVDKLRWIKADAHEAYMHARACKTESARRASLTLALRTMQEHVNGLLDTLSAYDAKAGAK